MGMKVYIHSIASSTTRVSTSDLPVWWYAKGPLCCDCARAWEYEYALDPLAPEPDLPCNYGKAPRAFLIAAIVNDDNKTVYTECSSPEQAAKLMAMLDPAQSVCAEKA